MARTADDEEERGRQRLAPRRRMLAGIAAGGWLLRLSALLIVLAAGGVIAVIWQLHEDALEDARQDSENLSVMLAGQTARAVQGIDIVLQAVMEDVDKHDWRTQREFRRVMATERVYTRMRQQLAQIPQADSLSVIGADGYLANTTRMWPMRELYLGDRDYFRYFADGQGNGIYFSQPVRNRVTDTWTIYVARRLTGPDGAFLGLVVAAVGLEWFDRVFGTIQLKRDERLFLFRKDGLSLARYPAAPERVGRKLPDSSPWYGVVARGGGTYNSPGSFSGKPSLAAVSTVGVYPLALNVLITYDAIFARWRSQATMLGSGAAILLGCAIVLMLAVRRQVQNLRHSQKTIQVRNARLAAISRELRESKDLVLRRTADFETTLQSMDQGIFLIDRDGVVTVYNQRAMELLDLPNDLLERQPAFAEVLAYQWHENKVRLGESDFAEFVRARSNFRHAYVGELIRPSGRVLEVRTAPTASGGAVRIYTDVTARAVAERRVKYFAEHDALTRLINRAHFGEQLVQAFDQARAARCGFAVMYVDLDGFKEVNDLHGHPAGDVLLVEVADRMREAVRSSDVVARIGGDEFAIILPAMDDVSAAVALAEQLIGAINRPWPVQGATVQVGASVGIAVFPDHGTTSEQILKHADTALYAAKRSGKNAVRVFSAPEPKRAPAQTWAEAPSRRAS